MSVRQDFYDVLLTGKKSQKHGSAQFIVYSFCLETIPCIRKHSSMSLSGDQVWSSQQQAVLEEIFKNFGEFHGQNIWTKK